MSHIGIPQQVGSHPDPVREFLTNNTGGALAKGDLVCLDEGAVDSALNFYRVKVPATADLNAGRFRVADEAIASGAKGYFLVKGEAILTTDTSSVLLGSDLIGANGVKTVTLAVGSAAGNKIFAKAKQANGDQAIGIRVDFDGENGYGSFGLDVS